ncbi:MAG: DUF4258 domain-containing protein [Thermodesulfobacteriota bacterium]
MTIRVIDKISHPQGMLYNVEINTHAVTIILLFHAIERMKKWGISDKIVIETMLMPEEVLAGHRSRYIAHKRYGDHVIRAVYEYQEKIPALVTVYFPYTNRYFKGGGTYENKVFKGS